MAEPSSAPPTSYLPPIKSLSCIIETHGLQECLSYLRQIYIPHVRGSSRRRKKPKSKPKPSNDSTSSELVAIRRDPFERAYSLRWLSALIRSSSLEYPSQELSSLQDDAAALLAICAGTAAAGTIQRTLEFDEGRIQVLLNDVPLSTETSDGDYFSSVGAQTWGGACVLAEEIADDPDVFFPYAHAQAEKPFRVLELGAGTGLVSLVAGKVAQLRDSTRQMEIIATDYYPSVLDNLKANIETNFPISSPSPYLTISSRFLDWSSFSTSPDSNSSAFPLISDTNKFDLILGADIIYEPSHASWIRVVLENTLRQPDSRESPMNRGGMFHLVIPLRPSFAAESSTIEQEFQLSTDNESRSGAGTDLTLGIHSKEIILCDADHEDEEPGSIESSVAIAEVGNGDLDEAGESNVVRYAYYVIGWHYTALKE